MEHTESLIKIIVCVAVFWILPVYALLKSGDR
jgi:hypothetical protein